MATCSYCQQRKGKRTCPALGGAICSLCCGQHRLVEIRCSSDCVHIGGLSVVRDTSSSSSFTKDDYNAVWEKLHAFADRSRDTRLEALSRCFDPESEPAEWEMGVMTGYLYYGFRDTEGQRLIDRFLAARGRALPPAQVAAIVALQQAWASLFEVASVQTGIGLTLRDLYSGDTVRVRDVSASGQLKKWDVLFGWVMAFPDHLELTGAACLVPRPHLDVVRKVIDAGVAGARSEHPGLSDRELAAVVAWAPIKALRAAFRDFKMPTLQTTDGEGMLFCKAHFRVEDEPRVRDRLAERADFEPDDVAYTWVTPTGNAVMGPGPVVLGNIRIGNGELVLETMSRERNERGKLLLKSILGDLIVHNLDSIQDPSSAIRDARDKPQRDSDEIPEDIQREIVGKYLQEHYRRWPDAPLPALGGKTPRKAARSRRGRSQVEALLKDIENGTIGMAGGDTVDFAGLRRELGLAASTGQDQPSRSGSYDADRAPDPAAWLAMDESLKTLAIEEHHRLPSSHPEVPNGRLHALMHMIVENQLAAGDPPTTRATLERLVDAGLTRHEALHAIASVVATAIFDVTQNNQPVDQAVIASSLVRLRPESWRFGR